jgi:hypothetical protein
MAEALPACHFPKQERWGCFLTLDSGRRTGRPDPELLEMSGGCIAHLRDQARQLSQFQKPVPNLNSAR